MTALLLFRKGYIYTHCCFPHCENVPEASPQSASQELQQLEMQTGFPLFSRGALELVCALFGNDAVTFERAIVPLNVVWLQPFRFHSLVAGGKRLYEELQGRDPEAGDYLMSSSACITHILEGYDMKPRKCFALPHFPLQSWRGVLPFSVLSPVTSCAFLPWSRVMRSMVADHPEEARFGFTVRLPCPRHFVPLLRWYDRGELWGHVEQRPCLALPLVVDHDRVGNHQTMALKEHGLSHMAIKSIQERMYVLELVGAANLLEEYGNCSLTDEGYQVSVSTFKGSATGEADCGPLLESDGFPVWNSPVQCPHRVRAYNRLLWDDDLKWHYHGFLIRVR